MRPARSAAEVEAAQALRHLCFAPPGVGRAGGREADAFDVRCRHVLIEDAGSGALAGCFRLLPVSAAGLADTYSAQSYDLAPLAGFCGPMLEIGRFCTRPGRRDPDILRAAWGWLAAHVAAEGVELLFGCTSFPGTDPAPFADTFALLAARHLAPARWRPGARAAEMVRFPQAAPDPRRALGAMPPLLRFYLGLGGRVGDHAVIDRAFGTLHVFTALEVGRVPAARAARLAALGAEVVAPAGPV